MKIVCTDTENCGHVEKQEQKQKEQKHATTCNNCGSIAFIYSDKYEPIYKKKFTSLDIENIILKGIVAIQYKEKEE